MLNLLLESIIIELNDQYDINNNLVVENFIYQTFEHIEKSKFLSDFEKEVRDSNITKQELKNLYFQSIETLKENEEI